MELSIVIVNWNSAEFTIGCIESIQAHTSRIAYEIIVVDNASEGEFWRNIAVQFPSIKLIRSDNNLGFARANNLGATHAAGKKLLFLNPDTLMFDNSIFMMASILDVNPDIGLLGARLLNHDLSLQKTCVQAFPTIVNQIVTIDWLKHRFPKLSIWGMRPLFSTSPSGVCDAEVVCGACLMLKREVFEKVGGFSTDYFMYAEEMDLCYKIRKAGWKVSHATHALVVHFGGQSTKKRADGFSHVVMRESVYKLLRKFRGDNYAALYRAAVLVSAVLRIAVLFPLRLLPARIVDCEQITWSYRKWAKIASWSLSLETWTRQLGSSNTRTVRN
jgi:N-acetylglucosaminyl-diphospho-decaprenol L-rhamnosyltransferase